MIVYQGSEASQVNQAACRLAEYVCAHNGATPALSEDLSDQLARFFDG